MPPIIVPAVGRIAALALVNLIRAISRHLASVALFASMSFEFVPCGKALPAQFACVGIGSPWPRLGVARHIGRAWTGAVL